MSGTNFLIPYQEIKKGVNFYDSAIVFEETIKLNLKIFGSKIPIITRVLEKETNRDSYVFEIISIEDEKSKRLHLSVLEMGVIVRIQTSNPLDGKWQDEGKNLLFRSQDLKNLNDEKNLELLTKTFI